MNQTKPQVCIIDDNAHVHSGWQRSLGDRVQLHCFTDPQAALQRPTRLAANDAFYCVVIARHFPTLGLDMLRQQQLTSNLKHQHHCPLFVSWPGSLPRSAIQPLFDGLIQAPYGMEWHSLRLKVQALRRTPSRNPLHGPCTSTATAPLIKAQAQACQQLLSMMATRALPPHKQILEAYARPRHLPHGIALLEAIYNRLLTHGQAHTDNPSHLIHSSPRIAARMLQAVLFPARSA